MWNLYLNVKKCKIVYVGRKKEETDYKMKINQDEHKGIVKCNEEKDLGVIFVKNFSFDICTQS